MEEMLEKNPRRVQMILLIIVMLGLVLRTWNLSVNPPELGADELVNFTSAKSAIETGKDLFGKSGFYFSDRVESRIPLYGCLAWLSTRFFGEEAFGIRFPAAALGAISLLLLYMVVAEFSKSRLLSLFSAFFLCIMPWHIHLSRIGWEPVCQIPIFLLTVWLFMRGIQKEKTGMVMSGFIGFGLLIYSYAAGPLYAFLFFIILIFLNIRYFQKHILLLIIGCLVTAILSIPFIYTAATDPNLLARAKRISTFASGFNMENLKNFFAYYFSAFDFKSLFITGISHLRLSPGTGLLYLGMFPFIVMAVPALFESIKKNVIFFLFLLSWLIIFPLGGSLVYDGPAPHPNRIFIGSPLFAVLAAIGVVYTINLLSSMKNKHLSLAFSLFILIASSFYLSSFLSSYFTRYPSVSAAYWETGHKEVFSTIKAVEDGYDNIYYGNLNYWIEVPMLAYYYPKPKLTKVGNAGENNPEIWFNTLSTLMVLTPSMPLPSKYRLIRVIKDNYGDTLFTIIGIDR